MDDRLLATFTYILVNIISFWINGAKMYLSKRPTAFVVSYICMLKYIFLTKKKTNAEKNNFNSKIN